MALSIRRADAGRLARELSEATGETITEAVIAALRERLERHKRSKPLPCKASDLFEAARMRLAKLPVLDNRTADEILGYAGTGLPR